MSTKHHSFIKGETRCPTYDCKAQAEGFLIGPEREWSSPSCRDHGEMIATECRKKLRENWTFEEGDEQRAPGSHHIIVSLREAPSTPTEEKST